MANKKIVLSTKNRQLMVRETVTSYLFLLPFLLFFVGFVLYPMFMCVYTSFFKSTMGKTEDVFIGLQNYKTMMWEKHVAADGTVTFDFETSDFHVLIAAAVEGYAVDTTEEYWFENGSKELTIVLEKK